MNIPETIFRAYDIRGIVGTELNRQTVALIGQALGTLAMAEGQRQFCVGYDGRHSSPELAEGLCQGLMASGMDVIDIGLVVTPLLYFATVHHKTGCGIMITGSHNPPEYNGLKMMIAGRALALDEITEIRNIAISGKLSSGQGRVSYSDVSMPYIDALVSQHGVHNKKKLVIDAGNGAASQIAPRLFTALGHSVIPLFCNIDGNFPNHHPDPGKPENMRDLQQAVVAHKADIGFAYDGDGDRLGIVTELGQIIYPDKAMMLLAEDMLSRHPGQQVIVDVKSSPLLVKHIESHGGKALVWKTGHSLIKRKMQETGALLAGEMSGHIFCAEDWYGFDDALLATARLLDILGQKNQPASQVFDAYQSWQGTPEINILTTDEDKFSIVQRLRDEGDFGESCRMLIDGVRIEYSNSWGIVRCSNTTPTLVLRFEGKDQLHLNRVINIFSREIQKVAPQLDQSEMLAYRIGES